jgi:hypothetical protein
MSLNEKHIRRAISIQAVLRNRNERPDTYSAGRERLTPASLSIERALIETAFYKENNGKYATPVMRALNFLEICEKKSIYIGTNELIVGERERNPRRYIHFPN